jgi:hypothetical protein
MAARFEVTSWQRVVALVLYACALLAIQYFLVDPELPPGTINGLWFYNGVASLLLGSRLLNPYFTPPGDAATNAFVSFVTILAASEALHDRPMDLYVLQAVGAYCIIVFVASIVALLCRAPLGLENSAAVVALDRAARALGNPNVIFTVVIVAAV